MVSTLPNVCTLLLRLSCATDTPSPLLLLQFCLFHLPALPSRDTHASSHPCCTLFDISQLLQFLSGNIDGDAGGSLTSAPCNHVYTLLFFIARKMGLDFLSPGALVPTRPKAAFRYSGSVRASAVLGHIASLQGTLKHADSWVPILAQRE